MQRAAQRLLKRVDDVNVWVLVVVISVASIAPLTVVEYSNSQRVAGHNLRVGDLAFLGASVPVLLALQVVGLWVLGQISGLRTLSPLRERCVVVTGAALIAMLAWVAFEAARDPYAAFAFFMAPFAVAGIGIAFFARAQLRESRESRTLHNSAWPANDHVNP